MRKAVVAGQFYSSDPKSLKEIIGKYVDHSPDEKVIGAVSPHAGYIYSGKTAGKVYSLVPPSDVFVIIGPNHTGYGSGVAVSSEDWETPLGTARVDRDFVEALPKKIIDTDEIAHRYEHSIEVQLPFLQYLFGEINIVPICMAMQDVETAKDVGDEILEASKTTGKLVTIIASSDMSHYLPEDMAQTIDRHIIEAIQSLDLNLFYKRLYERQATVCGYGPIATVMHISNKLGAIAELVDYTTSGEVADKTSVVGYGGLVFRRG
jgi:hypothetical protein